jgi:hypothetical protein
LLQIYFKKQFKQKEFTMNDNHITGPEQANNYTFTGEEYFSATDKRQVLYEWQRFIRSGFREIFFTGRLYRFLASHAGFIAHKDRRTFWHYFFNSDIFRLRIFINQFSGSLVSAETQTTAWLDGPAADLKRALCAEMGCISGPVIQILDDLEYKHQEMVRVWEEFALANSGLANLTLPPGYQIGENTRNLLAFAIQIALNHPPLRALQLQFPQPLLQPGYADA